MTRYEIVVSSPGDSTSSGTLRLTEREALALFEQDAATLSEGATITLYDEDREEIVARVSK